MGLKMINDDLLTGKYDEILCSLYGCDMADALNHRKRCLQVLEGFEETFADKGNGEVMLVSSPGRLELTGNHCDHQGGTVLTGTVNLDILACVAANGTDTVNIISEGFEPFSIECGDTEMCADEKNTSAALVRGMIKAFADKGFKVGGFDMYAVSDVAGGLGMSSSASFEVLVGTVLNILFCEGRLSGEQIAYAGMFAENEYFGKPCGLMDQMACISGGINCFDFSDAGKPAVYNIDFDLKEAGIDIVVTDTGTDHADMAAEFSAIPGEMFAVANAFGKKRLCEVEEECFYRELPRLRDAVGDRALMRAMHWYDEVKRVKRQRSALERGDADTFTELAGKSGRSSFMYLQNIDTYRNPEYEPVALSLAFAEHALNGKGVVRIQGGGFAGSIIAFVRSDHTEGYIKKMERLLGTGACRKVGIRSEGVYVF